VGVVTVIEVAIPAGPYFYLSFNWGFLTGDIGGPAFDPAGYSINGSFFQLSADSGGSSQSGSVSGILVNPGDVFGFYVNASDNCCGSATLTVDGFVAETPEPSTLGMFAAGLSLLGVGCFRRKF
jgi:hypothetical protein